MAAHATCTLPSGLFPAARLLRLHLLFVVVLGVVGVGAAAVVRIGLPLLLLLIRELGVVKTCAILSLVRTGGIIVLSVLLI
mmetsp:Transcript_31317/g.38770  ORF Transcript_31317/g.38770 Transcript_31317/m.38770 type:complete len:81 (+) Transcript_31317:4654-4896(+)